MDESLGDHPYVEPAALWWAFESGSAARRGATGSRPVPFELPDPAAFGSREAPAVVLLDEIDKADPDVPNSLLVTLGSLRFVVEELPVAVVAAEPPLVVITTNGERALPDAFVRRCVVLNLADPTKAQLLSIADAHLGPEPNEQVGLRDALATLVEDARKETKRVPSTAEFLDALRACRELKIDPRTRKDEWSLLQALVFEKQPSK